MPRGLEREHAEQEGNRQRPGSLEEAIEGMAVVERLRHGDVRAGFDLLPEAVDLVVEVVGRRIDGAGDREVRRLANRRAKPVVALVETLQDLDQADRVDVPNAGRRRVVADAWRIAGERDDVANTERVRGDQLRLERHQVLVAGGEVDQGVDANLLPDHERQRERAHADPRHRAVTDIDGVGARSFDELSTGDALGRIEAARWVDLHADDERAGREPLREWCGRELLRRVEVDRGRGRARGPLDPGAGGDRLAGRTSRGSDGRQEFGQVGEGLQHQQVGTAFEECRDLFFEGRGRLGDADPPDRLELLADRADRAGDEDLLARDLAGFPGELDRANIDVSNLAVEAMAGELDAVGAAGIGLDQLGACRHVRAGEFLDDLWLREV